MEVLLEQLERFAEVLAVSRTRHASSWGRVAVRRSLCWARYLRHVHGRFRLRGPVRAALEGRLRRLRPRPGPHGRDAAHAVPCLESGPLRSFEGLGCGEQLLALGLLENASLPSPALHELLQHLRPEEPAGPSEESSDECGLGNRLAELARRRAASQLLRPLLGSSPAQPDPVLRRTEAELLLLRLRQEAEAEPGAEALLLDRLWQQLPQPHWLTVVAEALLLQPTPGPRGEDCNSDEDDPGSPSDLGPATAAPLLAWLLSRPAPLAALCRLLPAPRLASLAGRHSDLAEACLDLLWDWASHLHFDLTKGVWVGSDPEGLTWERLRDCFRCFCQAPAPLSIQARIALDSCRARDGGFEAPGLSVWTDLERELGVEEPPGEG